MKIREILSEGLDHDNAKSIVGEFIKYAASELGLKSLPTINLQTDNKRSVHHSSFGGYLNQSIDITMSNRHVMDVCRTLAHELVHYRQDLNNELTNDSGRDGSPHENEANAQAAVIMRQWGKMHPELFAQPAVE